MTPSSLGARMGVEAFGAPSVPITNALEELKKTAPALYEIIKEGKKKNASDLQVVFGVRSSLRVDGDLEPVLGNAVVDIERTDEVLRTLFGSAVPRSPLDGLRRKCFDSAGQDDSVGRLRFHAYRERAGVALDVRYLRDQIPTLSEMRATTEMFDLFKRPHGLIVVTGPTGSGKSSLLAAITRYLYENFPKRIVTFEDPVEYLHPQFERGFISQCEYGADFEDWSDALRGVMRAAPNVIIVGEVRDKATAEACLQLAETGHLVLATMHVGETSSIARRILSFYPGHEQVAARQQLAESFLGAIGMRLVRLIKGGRRPVYEIMLPHTSVTAGLADGEDNLRSVLRSNIKSGMRTLEQHLSFLLSCNAITEDVAKNATSRPAEIKRTVDYDLEPV